ncbi:MAG: hypothetical protein VR64_12590 [Desulfatitalea sp. BRH_c12]|nr:MAG: hypothetical protein VR64_12590 [Desulfatitalea sp. BRH_c12]
MRKRFKERQRAKNAIEASRNKLINRVLQQENLDPEDMALIAPSEKMSEYIIDFGHPMLEGAKTFEDQTKAILFAVLAWNAALLPDVKRVAYVAEMKKMFSFPDTIDEILAFLIARKKAFFSEINRMVIDYDCIETPDGFYLNVVANR